jgi:hypothetical protein
MKNAPFPSLTVHDGLTNAAKQLLEQLRDRTVANDARSESLVEALREADAWIHRAAARKERDRGCYRTGAALEMNEGHLLPDISLTGADHLGPFTALMIAQVALAHPTETSLSGLLRVLFAGEHGSIFHEWGAWRRAMWNRELYLDQTVTFLPPRRALTRSSRGGARQSQGPSTT